MGAQSIMDDELARIGVSVAQRFESGNRGLLISKGCLDRYRVLIGQKLTPGFWNDMVGRESIVFLFKLLGGSTQEFTLSGSNRQQIAELCTAFSKDPIERTCDLPRYLAGNLRLC